MFTSQISVKILDKNKDLEALKYRCERLAREGQDTQAQERNIDSLKAYFHDLKQKLAQIRLNGEEFISQKQRWELRIDGQLVSEEEMSLLNSNRTARQVNDVAQGLLSTLMDQEGRLAGVRNLMADALKNINLAANITLMVRSRTREDNKLILYLTLGLILEIFLCLFLIKPMIR